MSDQFCYLLNTPRNWYGLNSLPNIARQVAQLRPDILSSFLHELNTSLDKLAEEAFFEANEEEVSVLYAEMSDQIGRCEEVATTLWDLKENDFLQSIPRDILDFLSNHPEQYELLKILAALRAYHEDPSYRLFRCLLYLSKGDVEAVNSILMYLWGDYHDLVLMAEYDNDGVRVRNFFNSFEHADQRLDELDSIGLDRLAMDGELPF